MDDLRRGAQPGLEYLHAVELSPSPVVGLDAAGAIRLFNSEAERLTGLSRDDVLGHAFVETLLDSLAPTHKTTLIGLLAADDGGRAAFVGPTRTSLGARNLTWTFVRIPRAVGLPVVLFGFGEDRAEDSDRARRAREDERTATVAALGTSLAHEIRNPLNGALLHVKVLERELKRLKVEGACRDALDVIEGQIQRLSKLVSEFLEFAQPPPPTFTQVSLVSLVDGLEEALRELGQSHGVELRREVANVSWRTDRAKFTRVLDELLTNAIEASPRGGQVFLRARETTPEELSQLFSTTGAFLPVGPTARGSTGRTRAAAPWRGLTVEVEDGGTGLPTPMPPIFEPFFSTKAAGTGLGLAIVRRTVTDLGGTLDCESSPGCTVFRMVFPDSGA